MEQVTNKEDVKDISDVTFEANTDDNLDQLENEVVKTTAVDYDSITEQTFAGVKYQDLLAKFKEVGVESAWKPGARADEMIKSAIEKIAVLKSLKTKGVEGDDAMEAAEKIIEINDVLETAAKDQDAAKQEVVENNTRAEAKKAIVDMDLDIEQLTKALDGVNLLLKDSVETHRKVLLEKQSIIMEIIEDM